MMDITQKIADLIAKAKRSMWGKSGLSSDLARNTYIAEYLIANGVTVLEEPIKMVIPEGIDEKQLMEMICNAPITILPSEPVQEWISVNEKLPKPGEDVLVVVFDGYDTYTDTDCLMRDGKWCYETENHKVTHWQPMPQPPKGE